MSTINEKLLLECIDAILSGDMKTAQRKFNNNWDRTALKVTEALDMEDSEEDAEIDSTVDDVIEDEAASEEDCFDDILAAVSELETKFPTEMTDEIQGHFDELKNKVDDLRLGSEEDDDEEACDAALMALDDLKSDFDLAGGLEDDVIDIFNESVQNCLVALNVKRKKMNLKMAKKLKKKKKTSLLNPKMVLCRKKANPSLMLKKVKKN